MPTRYPQEAVLRDGRRLLIRPSTGHDVDPLYEFFLRLPQDVRRFAWDRIDSRSLVESWGRELDYAKVLPLLAWDGHKVVADATLHRREGSPLRLVGRVKWLIEPAYRGVGLGTLLVNNFIDTARADGLRGLPQAHRDVDAGGEGLLTQRPVGRVPGVDLGHRGNAHLAPPSRVLFARALPGRGTCVAPG